MTKEGKIKIKEEHYKVIQESMSKISKEDILKHIEEVKAKGNYKNLNVRIAWDCFWACKLNEQVKEWYKYLNDEHLNTAVLKVFKESNITI